MNCVKCGGSVPGGSVFCNHCGSRLAPEKRQVKPKVRGNGQGTAYKAPNGKSWIAQVVVDYREPVGDHQPIPVKRKKSGFPTKAAALAYCPILKGKKDSCNLTLKQLYDQWVPWYEKRIDPDTMGCYRAAFAHFQNLHGRKIVDIRASDLQDCMDLCPRGHRTHQNMKVTAGLLWKYAIDHEYVTRNVAENLYIGKGKSIQRDPLTPAEVEKFRNAIGKERYAEYIYCLCYLGFRPGEFLSLKKEHYKTIDGIEVLVNGSKTDAGKDRIVVIPPQILDIVRSRLFIPGTDLLFPMYQLKRNSGLFKGFKPMTDEYLNKHVFKPLSASLGIADGKVPYSARHTYSDKLKNAEGTNKAKAGLMGHTDYAFTQSHYQSTDMDDLLAVAVSIE